MSETNHFITTNAFQYAQHLSGTVDPRTGMYRLQIQLGQLIGGWLMGPELTFLIQHHFLTKDNLGFGQGWTHNLTRYNHKHHQLHIGHGQSFQAPPSLQSVTEGEVELVLQYAKPYKFKAYVLANKEIRIQYKSGTCEYLNSSGFLKKIQLIDGRSLLIEYYSPSRLGKIKSIKDSHGQSLDFFYDESGVQITKNNQSTVSLQIHHNELLGVVFADGGHVQLEYTTINQCRVIKQLIHPLGAIESLTYDPEGLHAPSGSPQPTLPAVIHHRIFGNDIPSSNTTYNYSRHNYLGFAAGAKFVKNKDNLYERTHNYQYQSTEQNDTQIITRTYNRFHLVISEKIQDANSGIIAAHRKINYPADCTQTITNQPAIYALPISDVTTFYNDAGEQRPETHHYNYDKYGNLLSSTDPFGLTHQYEYYPAIGEPGCPAAPSDVPIYLKQKQVSPSVKYATGNEQPLVHQYRYSAHPTLSKQDQLNDDLLSQLTEFAVLTSEKVTTTAGKTISQRFINYYNFPNNALLHGRIKEETLLIGKHCTVDKYSYSQAKGTVQTIFHCIINGEKQYQETICHATSHGKRTTATDKCGITTLLTYDALARITKQINRANTEYQMECNYTYRWSERYCGIIDTEAREEKYILDSLGRVTQTWKTGADGNLQCYESKAYNSLGQLTSRTLYDTNSKHQIQQYTTYYEYNLWGEQCKETLHSGLARVNNLDKATNIQTSYLSSVNGEIAHLEINQLNEEQQIVASTINNQVTKYLYDGLRRLIKEEGNYDASVHYQYDVLGRVTEERIGDLLTIKKSYDTQSLEEWVTEITVNHISLGSRSYDYAGRVLAESKLGLPATHYHYTQQWPEPTQTILPSQVIINKTLDMTLGHTLTEHSSDQSVNNLFSYKKPTGELVSIINSHSKRSMNYQLDGKVKKEKQGEHQTHYQYSRQGNILSITDFFNQVEQQEYDSNGRLAKITQSQHQATYFYDEFDRVNKEVLISQADQPLIHQYFYDNYSRLIKKISLLDYTIICLQSFYYNARNMLTQKQLTDENGKTTTEQYQYDVLGRLSEYQVSGPNAPAYQDPIDPALSR